MKLTRLISLITAALCVLTLASCNDGKESEPDSENVMTVGEYGVTSDLYSYFSDNYRAEYRADSSNPEYEALSDADKEKTEEKIKEDTEGSLRKFYSVYSLAKKNSLSADDKEFTEIVDTYVDSLLSSEYGGDMDLLMQDIAQYHMTSFDTFRKIAEGTQLQDKLYLKLIGDKVIDDDAEKLSKAFLEGEMVRTKHILVTYDTELYSPLDVIGEGEAKQKAMETVETIKAELASGADFDSLIAKYNGDPLMTENTDGNYFTRGNKDLSYEECAFSLEENEISDAFETPQGYCFVQRLPIDEKYVDEHLYALIDSYCEGQFNIMLENEAATLEISYIK